MPRQRSGCLPVRPRGRGQRARTSGRLSVLLATAPAAAAAAAACSIAASAARFHPAFSKALRRRQAVVTSSPATAHSANRWIVYI